MRPIDGILVFGGYLVSWIIVAAGLGAVLAPKMLVLVSTVVPPGVAYLMLQATADRPLEYVGLVRTDSRVIVCAVLASLAAIVPVLSLESLVLVHFKVPHELLDELGEMIRARSALGLLYVLLVAAAGAALGEELIFRGILQRSLASLFGKAGWGWPSVVVASLVFSLLHDAWRMPAAFSLGMFLGILYWRTGSLLVPIVAHFTVNCTAIVAVYLAETRGETVFPEWVKDEKPAPAWLVGLCLVVVVALLRGLWKSNRVERSELGEGGGP